VLSLGGREVEVLQAFDGLKIDLSRQTKN
jgi:hypothetical protein